MKLAFTLGFEKTAFTLTELLTVAGGSQVPAIVNHNITSRALDREANRQEQAGVYDERALSDQLHGGKHYAKGLLGGAVVPSALAALSTTVDGGNPLVYGGVGGLIGGAMALPATGLSHMLLKRKMAALKDRLKSLPTSGEPRV